MALSRFFVVLAQNGWQYTFDPENPLAVDDEDNISTYDYTNQADVGLRTGVAYSGQAFGLPGTAITQTLGYNDRNELTSSERSDNADLDRTYTYDPIGNRLTSGHGDPSVTTTYTANELNQYAQTDTTESARALQAFSYDADGNVTEGYVVGDLNGDSLCNMFDITPFMYAIAYGQALFEAQYPNGCYWCGDINGDGLVNNFDITPFVALTNGGNSGVYVKYTWDAENRLIAVEPAGTPGEGDVKVEFAYDYLGRRIEKKVSTYDGDDWAVTADRRFVWAGWLMQMELEDGVGVTPVGHGLREYTWGLDLGGVASGVPAGRLGAHFLEPARGIFDNAAARQS